MRHAAQVVGQAERCILDLSLFRNPFQKLFVHGIDHAQPGSTDGMAKAFQSAVHLAGDLAVKIVESVHDVLYDPTFGRQVQVLHGNHLGDGKAVVHFAHADILARVFDAGLFIGIGRGNACGHEVGAVP